MGPVPDAEATTVAPRSRRSAYLAALRVPLVLAVVFAAVVGGYYLLYVTQVRDYLVDRNVRLLATMCEQIERTIESDRRILDNIRSGKTKEALENEKDQASRFIPILRTAEIQEGSAASGSLTSNVALEFLERRSQTRWVVYDDTSGTTDRSLFFRLRIDEFLQPLLRRHANDDTFALLLVAAPDGRVLFQTRSPLRIANLSPLTTAAAGGRKFDELARSSGLTDIVVSGTEYKLFIQPCCGTVSEQSANAPPGWVLCGLTAKRRLTAASLPVSFPFLAVLVPVLLFAVLSWPFVKLSLIGDTQRVTAYDAALVGICGLLGAALITVCALDLFGSSALQGRLDEQLEMFARQIQQRTGDEIKAASQQLERLDEVASAKRLTSATGKVPDLGGTSPATGKAYLADDELRSYPFFESFSLVGADGWQKQKTSVGSYVTPLIRVSWRGYFTYWRTGEYPPAMLEPVQSFTTGLKEVILSKPSRDPSFKVAALAIPMRSLLDPAIVPGFGFIIIDDDGAVLFHSDPQHTLSENFFLETDNNRRLRALVAARRTEWLDIKYWADDHRAFVSPLTLAAKSATLVTFYDKDLARAVHVEWLVLVLVFLVLYAGVYAAGSIAVLIVRPGYRVPWLWPDPAGSRKYLDLFPALLLLLAAFLVATAALDLADLLLTAWLLPAVAWAVAYLVLNRHGGWSGLAWPGLIAGCLVAPLLFVASRAAQPGWGGIFALLLAGAVIQGVIAVRQRERGGRSALAPPPNVSYGMSVAVLLIIVAVLPAVAFFRVAYDMQMETLVKRGQLAVSQVRADRAARDNQDLRSQVVDASASRLRRLRAGAPDWGIYESFFFSTQPSAAPGDRGCDSITTPGTSGLIAERDPLPEVMEELLPFYSEGAVPFRELAHDRTSDRAWQWGHDGRELVFCSPALKVAGLRSTVPGLLDGSSGGPPIQLRLAWLLLGSLAVLGVATWIVRFIIYNIFVADIIEPLWTGSGDLGREIWGQNLFLVSTAPLVDPIPSASYCVLDLKLAPPRARRWFAEQTARIERTPASQGVLILHFEERLENAPFNRSKLRLLERIVKVLNRTVVVVSAVPPSVVIEKEIESTRWWSDVLSLFTIVPVNPAPAAQAVPGPGPLVAEWATVGWREIVWRMNALGFAHAAKFLDSEQEDPEVGRLWKQVLPYAWHPEGTPLEVKQLLVEVGERAETHYREIWSACTPAEKLALDHIAEEGLVNRKTKATVRRLMARGLVRRQPHFVLMNETFRRFVRSVSSDAVVTALEDSSSNDWAAIRLPFLAVLVASLAFLFFTQHELFNTTLAVVTGVGTAVPAIIKMASLFGHQRGS